MESKIKDYLPLIITFSVVIAAALFIRPFIQPLISKFIVSMLSSQIGRIIAVIILSGEIILSGYLVYSLLTYVRRRGKIIREDKNGI